MLKHPLLVSVLLIAFAPSIASGAPITIDTVPVGNINNANDPLTGDLYGGMSYSYNIGKTEVTVGQYTAFLNAVAGTDTYSLYDTKMATDLNSAGIARGGPLGGPYSYSVIGSENKPVTYVSWGDAARFANWLHNKQPTGAQGPGTTETGAYTLNGAVTDAALNAVSRASGATWFIPNENEWYKAAFYQPAAQGGDSDSYWLYPMRTNDEPYSDQSPGVTPNNTQVGNFYDDDNLANNYNDGYAVTGSTGFSSTQNYLTDAGAYASSSSFYGTFDQGGNVWEWNEALPGGSLRGARGGSWDFGSDNLSSFGRYNGAGLPAIGAYSLLGFRVAAAPEPSTGMLAAVGLVGLAAWRWRRRQKA